MAALTKKKKATKAGQHRTTQDRNTQHRTVNRRAENASRRRKAIVDAALDEFVEKGFAAARIEDIARRAGVGKGTIYLHFSDKEALFEGIVRQEIRPKLDAAAVGAASSDSLDGFVDRTIMPLLADLVNTRRGAVIRLLIAEAGRFPKLAEVYYRVVVEPGLGVLSNLIRRSVARGELKDDTLLRFPQLVMAPGILAVVWSALFERFRPLDVKEMAVAYFGCMLDRVPPQKRKRVPRR